MSQTFAPAPVPSATLKHAIRATMISENAEDIASALFDNTIAVTYVHPTGEFVDTVGEVYGRYGTCVLNLRVWNTKKDVEDEAMMAVVSDNNNTLTTLDFFDNSDMTRIAHVLRSRVMR